MSEHLTSKIVFDNVSKTFSSTARNGKDEKKEQDQILKNISFNIYSEEFVCILGPSGSGKSTVLGLIAGFIKADSGSVLFNSKPITRPDSSRTLVFQEYALFPWLNILENIEFGLKAKKNNNGDIRKKALSYLELVGLSKYKDYSTGQISGGMKQRVAIARALAVDPEVLLLDEPFGALDLQTRENMQVELLRLWTKTKKTLVFVTHSVDEALKLADRIIVIGGKPGKVLLDTTIASNRPRDFQSSQLVNLRNKILDKLTQPDLFLGADI